MGATQVKARTVTLRLEPSLLERLDAIGGAEDRTRGWVIRRAIREFLERQEGASNVLR